MVPQTLLLISLLAGSLLIRDAMATTTDSPEPQVQAEQAQAGPAEDGDTAEVEREGGPQVVTVGFYVVDFSHFNIKENSVKVDFYVWFLCEDEALKPYETFELMNGGIEYQKLHEVIEIGGLRYATIRIKATVRQRLDASRFPLDHHRLAIALEDTVLETEELIYAADLANTKADPSISIPGYWLGASAVTTAERVYETNWGDFTLGSDSRSKYSRVVYTVEIQRDGTGVFFKTFLGYFISILIALTSFAIRPDHSARFSLGIGAIFATATNAIIVKSYLPENNSWTLADMVGIFTLFVIFMVISISALSLTLYQRNRCAAMAVVDRTAMVALFVTYTVTLLYLSLCMD